jgi:hypothetical protein
MDFTHAFIPVHAVPAHFLDPAAFRPEAPLNRAPRGFTIGWLGAQFAGRRHLPPLLLSQVEVADAPACSTAPAAGCVLRKGKLPTQPSPEFILFYASADGRDYYRALVTLIETRATWNSRSRPFGPCVARQNITLPRGRASIFMGWDDGGALHLRPPCPTRPFDRFFAYVLLGQTVIHVDAPGAQTGSRTITSEYNTRQAIEVIVRALRPRVPTHGTTGSNK